VAWQDIVKGIIQAGAAILGVTEFRAMLRQDRAVSEQMLAEKVGGWSAAELDEYEDKFLQFSCALVSRDEKIRAMELYVSLKVLETQKFGWRGYFTNGAALEG
jgi:hypothetical protein